MDIKKVFVDIKEMFGDEIIVTGSERFNGNQFDRVPKTYFQATSFKERDFYIVIEGIKNADVLTNGRAVARFPRGAYLENRSFSYNGKRINEIVLSAPELRFSKI